MGGMLETPRQHWLASSSNLPLPVLDGDAENVQGRQYYIGDEDEETQVPTMDEYEKGWKLDQHLNAKWSIVGDALKEKNFEKGWKMWGIFAHAAKKNTAR